MVCSLERIAWQWAIRHILEDNDSLQMWRESSHSPVDLALVMGEPMCWPKRFRCSATRSRFRVAVKSILCKMASRDLPFILSFSGENFELTACGRCFDEIVDSLRTRIIYITPSESRTVTHFLHRGRPFVLVGPVTVFGLVPGQLEFEWERRTVVPRVSIGQYPSITFLNVEGSEVQQVIR